MTRKSQPPGHQPPKVTVVLDCGHPVLFGGTSRPRLGDPVWCFRCERYGTETGGQQERSWERQDHEDLV